MYQTKVLVSACLIGEKVRHDGRDNLIKHPFLHQLLESNRVVSACPEVLGGLQTPRAHARIVKRFPLEIITTDQEDVTDQFLMGAESTLELAQQRGCVVALMKAGSPSCGNSAVPGGSFSGLSVGGAGVAAQELIHKGIPVFNEHQINELEAFLAQIEVDSAITA